MWLLVTLSVSVFLTAYLGWRIILPISTSLKRRLLAWLLLGVVLVGQRIVWMARRNGMDPNLLDPLDWFGFITLGFISFIIVFLVARDAVILTRRFVRMFKKKDPSQRKIFFKHVDPQRRRFLINASNACIMVGAAPLTAYSIYEARRMPDIVRIDHDIPNLHPDLNGLTVAQMSDTHIGPTIKGDWLAKCVDMVNGLKPDMVVHTGDLVDGHTVWLKPDVAPLADIKAPLGRFFCTGNHEYYSGVHEWLREIKRLGFTPLNNEHTLITRGAGRLLVAGVTDLGSHRIEPEHVSDPTKAIMGAPEHDYSLLLAHRPTSIYQAASAGYNLQISGHTHGGQFFPWTYVIKYIQPYVRGLYTVKDTRLYVNVGTGYWGPPLRLGAPPEITLHTLKRA